MPKIIGTGMAWPLSLSPSPIKRATTLVAWKTQGLPTNSTFGRLHFPSSRPRKPCPTFFAGPCLRWESQIAGSCFAAPVGGSRNLTSRLFATVMLGNQFPHDVCVAALTACAAFSLLKIWDETAKRRLFDQKLNRKLVHISIGLVFMLFWPMYSSGHQAAYLAALAPGVNIIRMLLVGLGIVKDEAVVKSMSRYNDRRELLKGPLYYASTITLATIVFWRTSPLSIAAICNLCAGDGLADIVGRRFGSIKLPYNSNKSFVGTITMALASFIACLGYMHYFSLFGLVEENWRLVSGFLLVSLASSVVESLPISTKLDDNLTVTVTCIVVGSIVF